MAGGSAPIERCPDGNLNRGMPNKLHGDSPGSGSLKSQQSLNRTVGEDNTRVAIEHHNSGTHCSDDSLDPVLVPFQFSHFESQVLCHRVQGRTDRCKIAISHDRNLRLEVPVRELERCLGDAMYWP
jgi:hypothetical protein